MKLEDIREIAVLGAGIMGHGIAQSYLMGGYPVRLYDVQESILQSATRHIEANLDLFARFELIKRDEIRPAMERLSTTCDLKQTVEGADFIVEAAPEALALKQRLFQEIEGFCPREAILASNTSSLTLKDIGVHVRHRERLVTTHWFNPPHIVPTVEVVKGPWTSEETFDTAFALLLKIKKVPIKIRQELPGFLINRIQIAMAREILDLYDRGVASAEDIDKAVRGSIGFRLASIGPLLTMDLGGIGLWLKVCENLLPQVSSSTEAPRALRDLVAKGRDGIKSGKGFYDYETDFSKAALDKAVKRRDQDFLVRLRDSYLKTEE